MNVKPWQFNECFFMVLIGFVMLNICDFSSNSFISYNRRYQKKKGLKKKRVTTILYIYFNMYNVYYITLYEYCVFCIV